MIRALAVIAALLAPTAGAAAEPSFWLIDGVEADDVLNVRAGPSAGSADIGDLPPDGPGVTVLEMDDSGGWGRIAWDGGDGWVAMRFLRPGFTGVPVVFRVTGVAADDVLNVRAEPSASSAIIGDVGTSGAMVEVVDEDPQARWGRVVHGEGNGWVSLAYLAPAEIETIGTTAIPAGLHCSGTEPFWSLWLGPREAAFETPEVGPAAVPVKTAVTAAGRIGFPAAVTAGDMTAVVRPMACSDGMSDRLYGWTVDVIRGGVLHTGCCGIALD